MTEPNEDGINGAAVGGCLGMIFGALGGLGVGLMFLGVTKAIGMMLIGSLIVGIFSFFCAAWLLKDV